MAQQMRVDMLFQSCPLADRADNTLNCPRFERLVWRFAGHKQAGAALALHDVLLHHQPRTNREVHHAVLIALACDLYRPADKVEIGGTQLRDLTQAAASGHQKFHERFLPVAFASVAQALQFFHGQRLPCAFFVQLQGLDFAHRVFLDFLLGVQPAEERSQRVDVRLQTGFLQMAGFVKVRDVAANVVRSDFRRTLFDLRRKTF